MVLSYILFAVYCGIVATISYSLFRRRVKQCAAYFQQTLDDAKAWAVEMGCDG